MRSRALLISGLLAAPLLVACGRPAAPAAPGPAAPGPAGSSAPLASTAPSGPGAAPVVPTEAMPDFERFTGEIVARLRAAAAGRPRLAVLVILGAGERPARARQRIAEGLRATPAVAWSEASKSHEAPVSDGQGGHVHAVSYRFDPPPDLVLHVGERDGKMSAAVHAAGADPFNSSNAAWLWILSSP